MTDEGWGGTAKRNHYIIGGRAICGRVPPSFEPTIFACSSEADRARYPEQYCRFCGRMVDGAVTAALEVPRGAGGVPDAPAEG